MSLRKIIFDIETRNTFQEAGSSDPKDLDISVVCAYDSGTDTYTSYLVETLKDFWPLIEQADMLVTFNGNHFDIPLLNKYYSGDLSKIKSLDLLAEVRASLGRRIKLDSIAEATLGLNKIAHGLEAIAWWKAGEIDKIIKYCMEDVRITKEIYEYALKNKHLKYPDGSTIKDIKLDTRNWETKEETTMNFTLPF
ncbi:MAG: ribonuclease H-like domain-containing protein [Candidatus Taylorbacteria bacterium]|nr:ribonuclease H-like domain-containing protein [Candidatus Taylorbacteria bacterium]